jgi:hypothetical protein
MPYMVRLKVLKRNELRLGFRVTHVGSDALLVGISIILPVVRVFERAIGEIPVRMLNETTSNTWVVSILLVELIGRAIRATDLVECFDGERIGMEISTSDARVYLSLGVVLVTIVTLGAMARMGAISY